MIRFAQSNDVEAILTIYNQGIADRIATLEVDPKDLAYMATWFENHTERYRVFVAEINGEVVGWADLHP